MILSKDNLISISAAWIQFKNGHVKEVYIHYRNGDEKHINFVMQKSSWYYGENSYSVFTDGFYVCGFTVEALDWIASVHFPGEYSKSQSDNGGRGE